MYIFSSKVSSARILAVLRWGRSKYEKRDGDQEEEEVGKKCVDWAELTKHTYYCDDERHAVTTLSFFLFCHRHVVMKRRRKKEKEIKASFFFFFLVAAESILACFFYAHPVAKKKRESDRRVQIDSCTYVDSEYVHTYIAWRVLPCPTACQRKGSRDI